MSGKGQASERRGTILLADDTPDNLRRLTGTLTERGYTVHPATSGRAALRLVEATRPDLALLAVHLPGMDGYAVCERLKADRRTRDIPVIFLSAADQVFDKARAFAAGGVDYLAEPFQAEEVLARVDTHLSLRRLQAEMEERVRERTSELVEANARLVREAAERTRAEEAVARTHRRFEALVHSIDGIMWEADAETFHFSFVSQQAERILGYPVRRWLDEPDFWAAHLHPDDREQAVKYCVEATRRREAHQLEYRMVAADGRVVWLRDIVSVEFAGGERGRLRGIMVDITERKRAEQERHAHLHFFASLDRVNRAIQRADDLEQMMSYVLDEVLSVFACDRAWLLYPLEPEAASWQVILERTRPEYPGALARGGQIPMDADVLPTFRAVKDASGPVKAGPGYDLEIPAGVSEAFQVQSQMMMGVYPKVDKPYMFGLHQCSYARAWTPEEERLFNEIGRRLGDALTSLLTLRNLRESERRLEEAQRLAHVGWWDRDFVSGTITLSEEAYRILCVAPERRIQYLAECERHWQEAIHPQDRESVIRAADAALGGGPRYDVKYRITRLDGELRTVRSQGDVTRDEAGQPRRMFGFIQDITELKHAEEQLCASLREKEVLLKEVHHRVKNNLQLISSLLSLQAGAAKNREVADVLIESQNRVRAMALVHEYLYRSADLPSVRLADYIQSLSTHLYHSYNVDPERIALEFHVGDVAMDLDRSIRCGLIINELVSNAIKHAFPGGRKGRVTINLCSLPDGRQSLTVSDNGVGLPPDVAPWHTDSIGLQLVADLTDQLGGTLTVSRDGGTTINIKCSATKQGGTNYTTH